MAKAYRLLRTILNTAVDDGTIRRNPCRIKGAGIERIEERPVLSARQVLALTNTLAPRYRALVLLATFASLCWGELIALRRRNIDLEERTVAVEAPVAELDDGSRVLGSPKSDAGRRAVAIPEPLSPYLRWHLQRFAEPGTDGLASSGRRAPRCGGAIFTVTGRKHSRGLAFRRSTFRIFAIRVTHWRQPPARACGS